VFPTAEHQECMIHLVANFKKRFHGKVFNGTSMASSLFVESLSL
jgi:hypothetical protein